MGTQFQDGQKPKNRITISKGGDVPARKLSEQVGGEVDRSFAQPNPALPARDVEPKVHASEHDAAEALSKNSQEGRNYDEQGEGDNNDSE